MVLENEPVEILLVEDNRDDQELTEMVFRKYHVTNHIRVVRDGEEALEFMFGTGRYEGRDPALGPKVVLLDIKLPKVDGIEVLRRIRGDERTKNTPVVMLTSSREEQDIVRAYELGNNSYIVKPVDFEQFTEAIRNVGFYWLLLNTPPTA